jgi:hypothetical protein
MKAIRLVLLLLAGLAPLLYFLITSAWCFSVHSRIRSFGGHVLVPIGSAEGPVDAFIAWPSNACWVDLTGSKFGDADAEILKRYTGLARLNLGKTRITSAGLGFLAEGERRMGWLYLYDTAVDDGIAKYLSHLPYLRRLDLMNTQVTDDGIQGISTLKWLRELDLGGTRVSDLSIPTLEMLPKGAEVNLAKTRVTMEGITALHAKRPDLVIYYWDEQKDQAMRFSPSE